MTKRQKKAAEIYRILLEAYGPQKCFLSHETPLQLLVATILSAQCTDKMVNSVTRTLFTEYPDAEAFANADRTVLEQKVRKCGYYRAKAANIQNSCRKIVEEFHGVIPSDMEQLTSLPGVGRKTANVVLGDAFGVPGLPVDTHVKRLSNRIGLADSDDPEKIEQQLCADLAPEFWAQFSHLLILHGRLVCKAGKTDCANCILLHLCKYGKKQCR